MKLIRYKSALILVTLFCLQACTTSGRLAYITAEGENRTACETEFFGLPKVDRYAVEYVLSYCAKQAVKNGHTVLDERLIGLDLTLPRAPQGKQWNHELAKEQYARGLITDKEYGYVVAFIDLGLGDE